MSDEQVLGEEIPESTEVEQQEHDNVDSNQEDGEQAAESEQAAEGEQEEGANTTEKSGQAPQGTPKEDPIEGRDGLKARLGRQEKRHQKELRALNNQIAQLHANLVPETPQVPPPLVDPMTGLPIEEGSVEHTVLKVLGTLNAQQQKAQHEEMQLKQKQMVRQEYDSLSQRLEEASDIYPDFDEVVLADHVPVTHAMRDAALLIPNAEDVLYRICKDPKELNRIINLPPLEQGREMVKMSNALAKKNVLTSKAPAPMKSLKTNPAPTPRSSSEITEKSTIAEIEKALASWR